MTWMILTGWVFVTAGLSLLFTKFRWHGRRLHWPKAVVAAATLTLVISFVWLALWQHAYYETHGHDLGLFDQGVWHLSQFEDPASTIRKTTVSHLFGDHFDPILFLLVPLYWICNSPIVLLVAQALLLASVVPLSYWLARLLKLDAWPAALLAVVFGLQPGLLLAIQFDFHEIAFAVPLIILAYGFAIQRRWLWYTAVISLLLLVKESVAPTVTLLGLTLILQKRWRVGTATLLAGAIWFVLATKLIIPSFADDQQYAYWVQYKNFGTGPGDMLTNLIKNPLPFVQAFFDHPEKTATLNGVLGPVAFLPLLSWTTWPLIGFEFAERFWTDNLGLWRFQFHYQLVLTGVVVIASLISIVTLQNFFRLSQRGMMVGCAGLLLLTIGFHLRHHSFITLDDQSIRQRPVGIWNQALKKLPRTATVSAQDAFVPHLSQRRIIYQFPRVRQAEYIVLDPRAPGWPLTTTQIEEWQRQLRQNPNWQLTAADDTLTIFQRLNSQPLDTGWPEWK